MGPMAAGGIGLNWEIVGGIEVDAATVAFGDSAALGDNFVLETGLAIATMSGSPEGFDSTLVLQVTREDCPLPVEVCADADGQRMAARMCFTNDVDELAGTWRKVGRLIITGDRCVAMDPVCEGEGYRCVFDLPPGTTSPRYSTTSIRTVGEWTYSGCESCEMGTGLCQKPCESVQGLLGLLAHRHDDVERTEVSHWSTSRRRSTHGNRRQVFARFRTLQI